MMGCHTELWFDRPGLDPSDDGRITESMKQDLLLTVLCSNAPPNGSSDTAGVKVFSADCAESGIKGAQIGEYTAKVKCAKCN
jgi:hypothetical protein